jgi:hypothetical protein
LIIYLDIIGFTDKVEESRADERSIQEIAKILSLIEFYTHAFNTIPLRTMADLAGIPEWHTFPPTLSSVHFSDTIVMAVPNPDCDSILTVASLAAAVQHSMIAHGYFLRGAITVGPHYTKGNVMFGPAFLRAYELEKCAIWPRLILDPAILALPGMERFGQPESFVTRAEDGLPFVDYLGEAFWNLGSIHWYRDHAADRTPTVVDSVNALSGHRAAVLGAVQREVTKKHSIRPNTNLLKYHRLARYHNTVIRRLIDELPDEFNPANLEHLHPRVQVNYSCALRELQMRAGKTPTSSQDPTSFINSVFSLLSQNKKTIANLRIDLSDAFPDLYPQQKTSS